MNSDTELLVFKSISSFVNESSNLYGKKHHPLLLYSRLINKTTIAHVKPIQKHITAFRTFCVNNRNQIMEKDVNLLDNTVKYSDNVYIDMDVIFSLADKEEMEPIWNHILTISAFLDPEGRAKQILKESMKPNDNGINNSEAEFISNIIDKVEENVDPEADPMTAVSSIMSSGVFTELISGMHSGLSDGSLDISRLMGAVSNVVTKIGGDESGESMEGGPDMSALTGMISTLTTQMGGMNPPPLPDSLSLPEKAE